MEEEDWCAGKTGWLQRYSEYLWTQSTRTQTLMVALLARTVNLSFEACFIISSSCPVYNPAFTAALGEEHRVAHISQEKRQDDALEMAEVHAVRTVAIAQNDNYFVCLFVFNLEAFLPFWLQQMFRFFQLLPWIKSSQYVPVLVASPVATMKTI